MDKTKELILLERIYNMSNIDNINDYKELIRCVQNIHLIIEEEFPEIGNDN